MPVLIATTEKVFKSHRRVCYWPALLTELRKVKNWKINEPEKNSTAKEAKLPKCQLPISLRCKMARNVDWRRELTEKFYCRRTDDQKRVTIWLFSLISCVGQSRTSWLFSSLSIAIQKRQKKKQIVFFCLRWFWFLLAIRFHLHFCQSIISFNFSTAIANFEANISSYVNISS